MWKVFYNAQPLDVISRYLENIATCTWNEPKRKPSSTTIQNLRNFTNTFHLSSNKLFSFLMLASTLETDAHSRKILKTLKIVAILAYASPIFQSVFNCHFLQKKILFSEKNFQSVECSWMERLYFTL